MSTKYKLSKFLEFNDLKQFDEERDEILVFSSVSNSLIQIDKSTYVSLIDGRLEEIPQKDFELLIGNNIVVKEGIDEIKTIIEENKDHASGNNVSLVLHSSANCQFGCSYCGQAHVKKNISSTIKDKIYDYTDSQLKKSTGDLLYVMWHGAEPLMSLANLREMSQNLIRIAAVNNVDYKAKIITNALSLKPAIFEELYNELKITEYQITIDGNKDYHDSRRMTKDNKPTFDIIMKNIIEITSNPMYDTYNYPIEIRINIDSSNADGIYGLIDLFSDLNLQDKIFISFYPVVNYTDNKFKNENDLTLESYAQIDVELLLYSIKKGFRQYSYLPGRTFQTCMAVNKNATMIDIYGNMYPCYSFPYTKHELESVNKIGNVIFDDLTYNNTPVLRNWYNEILETKNQCYDCSLLPSCGGSCPIKWHEGETPCPSFRFNIKERMLLEYLNVNNNFAELLN